LAQHPQDTGSGDVVGRAICALDAGTDRAYRRAVVDHSLDVLRPVERCVLRMSAAGLDDEEIGARLHRSAAYVERVRSMSAMHTGAADHPRRPGEALRPIERAVLHRLEEGVGYDDLARRLHRHPGFVEFVESLAYYKLER
jgi:DNA-binding NarL/FixJ family response regulator